MCSQQCPWSVCECPFEVFHKEVIPRYCHAVSPFKYSLSRGLSDCGTHNCIYTHLVTYTPIAKYTNTKAFPSALEQWRGMVGDGLKLKLSSGRLRLKEKDKGQQVGSAPQVSEIQRFWGTFWPQLTKPTARDFSCVVKIILMFKKYKLIWTKVLMWRHLVQTNGMEVYF